ncbi:hypothetical protein M3231_05335 [Neobacillus mesonae]|nr:hypothetical protein [Neobacillus mesonae]
MHRSAVLTIIIFMLLSIVVGFQSNETNEAKSAEKLVVLKRAGSENKFENDNKTSVEESIITVKVVLGDKEEWKKVKPNMIRPPDYKLYIDETDVGNMESILYDVWFTNGAAEVYIQANNSYRKLTEQESKVLYEVIS